MKTVAGPPRAEEEETDHYVIESVDPDGDEPAGADEEWRYFKKGKKKASSYVPIGTYDRDDPKIQKGSTFVDKATFIMIFKQFCIKNEFETKLKHSDQNRYKAKCNFSGCDEYWS
ncbi:hypothetical protein E2562_011725 [Oryza meyeriana var. granulata]|uniref:Uncharacterized protein n=1 Tax=Oryza meyeriana var. granulata TaxID=110450 RepID=A0A6G1DGI3_9ORYZ|nr:hypothetical protein E2562_011725 [Oryza meyeriana var. granulata]